MTNSTELETVARQLCRENGFHPEEVVDVGPLDWLTQSEQLAHRSGTGETHVRVPRWMTYRKLAEQKIQAGLA